MFASPGRHPTDEKGIAVIRPAEMKHGRRKNWREREFAQLAIRTLVGATRSKILNHMQLPDVNDWLRQNSDWRASFYFS